MSMTLFTLDMRWNVERGTLGNGTQLHFSGREFAVFFHLLLIVLLRFTCAVAAVP